MIWQKEAGAWPARSVLQAPLADARHRVLPTGWPLIVVLLMGFPIGWALGAGAFWPMIAAVPMLLWLLVSKHVHAPRGFALWVGFLAWMLASGTQLDTLARAVGFAWRAGLFFGATVTLLYVFNMPEHLLPTRRVLVAIVIFWIYVVVGGFLGILFPHVSWTTPVQAIMPGSILSNSFVYELVHPKFAQVQDVLGYSAPRPSAPFVYTNDWGGAFALLAPLVILAWGYLKRGSALRTVIAWAAVASIIPVVMSLNRGLWISLFIGLAYAAVRLAIRGRERALVLFLGVSLLAGSGVFLTPLLGVIEGRLAGPSGDRGREALYKETLSRVAESPVFGYGAPRPNDISNYFAPPDGSHGIFWATLFSHGIPGAFFFFAWYLLAFWRTRRGRGPVELWVHVSLLIFLLQTSIYDCMIPAQPLMMIAIGLAAREQHLGLDVTPQDRPHPDMKTLAPSRLSGSRVAWSR